MSKTAKEYAVLLANAAKVYNTIVNDATDDGFMVETDGGADSVVPGQIFPERVSVFIHEDKCVSNLPGVGNE